MPCLTKRVAKKVLVTKRRDAVHVCKVTRADEIWIVSPISTSLGLVSVLSRLVVVKTRRQGIKSPLVVKEAC